MSDYRVQLDIYNGPMDLLLYLIRKDELDIYDIPISKVADQYVEYIEVLHKLDPNLAGEFLVMAATLMEIKSRMLLPRDVEDEQEGDEFDPRTELVRQLLQYKQFKDAASWLGNAADERSRSFSRVPVLPKTNAEELELEDVQLWDLVEAFGKLMEATLAGPGLHEIEHDDTPLALHQEDLLDRLQREGPLTLSKIFEGRTKQTEMIGLFLAMLELIRQGMIQIDQDEPFADIYIYLKVEIPDDVTNNAGEQPPETPKADHAGDEPS